MIRAALAGAGVEGLQGCHANELACVSTRARGKNKGRTSGTISGKLHDPFAKRALFKELIAEYNSRQPVKPDACASTAVVPGLPRPREAHEARTRATGTGAATVTATGYGASVAIGDSIGDLLMLLHADVGIVYGTSGSLKQICTAFGIRLVPLSDVGGFGEQPKGELWCTASWQDIHSLLCD